MIKGLTQKQTAVLHLMAAGHTDFEIADLRYVTRKTVSAMVSIIIHKLGAANRPHAVLIAAQTGLIRIEHRHHLFNTH